MPCRRHVPSSKALMGVPNFLFKFRICALRDPLTAVLVQLITWLVIVVALANENFELEDDVHSWRLPMAQYEDEMTCPSEAQV